MVEVNLAAYLLLSCLLCGQMMVLLWAGGAVVGLRPSPVRLVAGALGGTVYAALVDLAAFGVLSEAGFLSAWYVVLAVSLTTHAAVYWPLPAGRLLPALGAYYFLAVIGAGTAYAAYNLGARGWIPPLVSTAVILAAAELGWGVVQRWVWDRVVYLPLEIELLGRRARVTALLDTGNRLVDPLTGQPVIVLGPELGEVLLPPEAAAVVAAVADNPLDAANLLIDTPLASRLRLIPYSTLGTDNGLLLAFRADAVRLVPHEPLEGASLVAFHRQPLDPAGAYQALVHPALLRTTLARASRCQGRLVLRPGVEARRPVSRPGG